MRPLVFVDTNILLDFYRVRGRDTSLSILTHFDGNHDRIITTGQVEMEYKKNRQGVILQSLKALKAPDMGTLVIPAFLHESQPKKRIEQAKKRLNDQIGLVKQRIAKLLQNPAQNDPIYKTLQRLFVAGRPHHLTRKRKERFEIRRLAKKRFVLGYPPRKDGDTSIGDAINWEWLIYCANEARTGIVIVSRDSDYGLEHDGVPVLNDWLRQEFKERVSRKREITLTSRLTEGFKLAGIAVTPKEEREEEELVKDLKTEKPATPKSLQEIYNWLKHAKTSEIVGSNIWTDPLTINVKEEEP